MSNAPAIMFGELMALEDIDALANDAALDKIALLIDLSGDLKRDDGTDRALAWCDQLAKRPLSETESALLDYFSANAWANRQRAGQQDLATAWQWDRSELLNQIFHLRRAAQSSSYEELPAVRQCQIQTNLGNQLNTLGRFIDALPVWNRALAVKSRFGMALGNRGYGLSMYASSLYDTGHRGVFLVFAHKALAAALAAEASYDGPHYDAAKSFFASIKSRIEETINVKRVSNKLQMDGHDLGASRREREYRQWALQECLFLNPLNDLGPYSIAARDVLTLPDFVTPIKESPTLIGLYNQMKQEFVSARWLLFEGLHSNRPHFSDRDVLLMNTLDYPSYSLAVEKVKAAYRIAYSIFDKIAFFLNDYAKLEVSLDRVYFRTIWYVNCDAKNRVIRPELVKMTNWPLRGLFWLSKDFFDPKLQDVMEPDARALYIIRNRLEHSYLKIHEMLVPNPMDSMWTDRLAYSVQRDDFEAKTLRLLKLARAAMIYLSLGMYREERRRDKGQPVLRAPMPLDSWPDDWKR